ncbi:MAG: hypothetical protein E6I09_09840 [Chloroflexi bacterium]|nr:MAG: hypothetical protein E6I09_09840 [Chloroflexota bacterium]
MTLAVEIADLVEAAGRLPMHGGTTDGALPGHPFFGAGFLFIGSLMVVELLAGGVWSRAFWRRMLWPGALLMAGAGMLLVSYVQTDSKSLHLTLAMLLLLGAYTEAQYKLGKISRLSADAFAIPALIVGGFVIGPMHANGNLMYSTMAQMHLLVGVVAWMLASVKIMRVRFGPTLALEYSFASGVMMLGLSLLLVQQFHGAH